MTKNMVFVFGIGYFLFLVFCYFFINDLTLNDMILILDVDMNATVSIETHVTYDKYLF
jgi:uncharacterized membrane protein